MIKTVVIAEWKKIYHSFIPWLWLVGALLIPLVCGLIYGNRSAMFDPEPGMNAWNAYVQMNISMASGLLLPFLVILLVAMNVHPEHKGNTWKRLLVLPVSKGALYFGKGLFLVAQLFGCLLLFVVGILVSGSLVTLIHPSLALSGGAFPLVDMLWQVIRLFVSLLAILSLQYVFSLLTNNILIPVIVGVFMMILSLVLVQGWSYVVYDPYAFPIIYAWDFGGKMPQPHWMGLTKPEWLSILVSVVVGWLGFLRFKTRSDVLIGG